MKVADVHGASFADGLQNAGVTLRTGAFTVRVRSPLAVVAQGMSLLYADYPPVAAHEFCDFDVRIDTGRGARRWFRPQARFVFDGHSPFDPLPAEQGFLLLEWAMNWCVSSYAHHVLVLHAAVVERNGFAAILAAPSGSGKSTLCAGLVSRGWRLLSDELTLISPADLSIQPLGRPISLKNRSIDVMRSFAPEAVFNHITSDTVKGAVTHMKVPPEHLQKMAETAQPKWVIFPRYLQGAPATLTPRSRANSVLELGRNAFNYAVLGTTAFEVLGNVVAASDCYDFAYGDLNDAVSQFDQLAESVRR